MNRRVALKQTFGVIGAIVAGRALPTETAMPKAWKTNATGAFPLDKMSSVPDSVYDGVMNDLCQLEKKHGVILYGGKRAIVGMYNPSPLAKRGT